MTFENYCSFTADLLQVATLLFLVLEMRKKRIQDQSRSVKDVQKENRELVTLGFSNSEFYFRILDDEPVTDTRAEKRYLQLWLNLYHETFSDVEKGIVKGEQKDAFIRDISASLARKNTQQHWVRARSFYPVSFQNLVDKIIEESKKAQPPRLPSAARED